MAVRDALPRDGEAGAVEDACVEGVCCAETLPELEAEVLAVALADGVLDAVTVWDRGALRDADAHAAADAVKEARVLVDAAGESVSTGVELGATPEGVAPPAVGDAVMLGKGTSDLLCDSDVVWVKIDCVD